MLGFRKKRMLRKEEDDRLYIQMESIKERLDYTKRLVEHSVDPSEEILGEVKRVEMLYSLLLREARVRHVRKPKMR
ncbi:YaaL family protein [Bacillus sp. JCM 19041]|uniref:YaaL family protein n=1 Tax=Bacillus sp. JCM 19041 TaxID=1460637 RepID=UPI0006D261B9